ncbi:MAG: hypothetical protein AB7K24_10715 [Gemmataceae bacterium]
MKACCYCLLGLALLAVAVRAAEPDAELKKLMSQRVEALTKARAASIANWKAGRADFTPIVIVERELIEARLALAGNDQERLKTFENQVTLARELEKTARASLESGRTNELPLQLATALRLGYEIQIAQLKNRKD